MEMRALTRSLRSRPATTSILYTQRYQQTLRVSQFPRFNSSSSSSSSPSSPSSNDNPQSPPTSNHPFHPPQYQSTSNPETTKKSINTILNELNLNNSRTQQQRPRENYYSAKGRGAESPLAELSRDAAALNEPKQAARIDLKLGPTLGRQVAVEPDRGVDLAGALRKLNSAIARNNVKKDSFTQKYHVRRGQVRKNLRIRRWRELFKFSFQHTVNKIKRMRAQGW
ncbi:mitochondrial 37S ribosomal protein bS21m [Aspergillus lucknowensis]|uniref:Ribosomal protein S21 n=1 Tax=Aspergillus lucknowensis TaxID=176173 RepID=A0ABR4M7B4_9EURO